MDNEFDVYGNNQAPYQEEDDSSNVFGLDGVSDNLQAPASLGDDIFSTVNNTNTITIENTNNQTSQAKLEWDEKKKLQLEKRALEQKQAFKQNGENAKKELLEFQQKREEKIQKNKQLNIIDQKQQQKDTAETLQHGTTWEKVAKYSDLKPKHDVKATQQVDNNERMRVLMIDLKNDPNAP